MRDEGVEHGVPSAGVLLHRGATLGRVVAVHNYGAGDILEIAPLQGATWLLPFSNAAVPKVDIAGGTLTIDPPNEIEGDDPAQADM